MVDTYEFISSINGVKERTYIIFNHCIVIARIIRFKSMCFFVNRQHTVAIQKYCIVLTENQLRLAPYKVTLQVDIYIVICVCVYCFYYYSIVVTYITSYII